jgi:hypothetical protein
MRLQQKPEDKVNANMSADSNSNVNCKSTENVEVSPKENGKANANGGANADANVNAKSNVNCKSSGEASQKGKGKVDVNVVSRKVSNNRPASPKLADGDGHRRALAVDVHLLWWGTSGSRADAE